MATANNDELKNKKQGSGKIKLLMGLVVLLILALAVSIFYFQYVLFKTKAEGIAIGYQRAIVSAYQAQRPIPDTIFEEGMYRVEVKTQGSGNMFLVTINVRDKYTNITHYAHSDSINMAQNSNTPASLPSPNNNNNN